MQQLGSKLDWSRMLGFEQVTDHRSSARHSGKLGAKIGSKPGLKA
jgi:hypothetical protein